MNIPARRILELIDPNVAVVYKLHAENGAYLKSLSIYEVRSLAMRDMIRARGSMTRIKYLIVNEPTAKRPGIDGVVLGSKIKPDSAEQKQLKVCAAVRSMSADASKNIILERWTSEKGIPVQVWEHKMTKKSRGVRYFGMNSNKGLAQVYG